MGDFKGSQWQTVVAEEDHHHRQHPPPLARTPSPPSLPSAMHEGMDLPFVWLMVFSLDDCRSVDLVMGPYRMLVATGELLPEDQIVEIPADHVIYEDT